MACTHRCSVLRKKAPLARGARATTAARSNENNVDTKQIKRGAFRLAAPGRHVYLAMSKSLRAARGLKMHVLERSQDESGDSSKTSSPRADAA